MNTACSGGPPMPATDNSVSKLSTCVPKALRLTTMSTMPSGRGRGSVRRRARSTMPAHVPQAGSPPAKRARNGSRSP